MHSETEEDDNQIEDIESEEENSDSDPEEDSDVSREDDDDDEEEEEPWVVDVWEELKMKANSTNESFLEIYKEAVVFTKSLKRDETHLKVMETFNKAQEEDDMDFQEALDFAVDRRKFLIVREFQDDSNDQYKLNDNKEDGEIQQNYTMET